MTRVGARAWEGQKQITTKRDEGEEMELKNRAKRAVSEGGRG